MARPVAALALAGVPQVNLMPRAEVERRQRGSLIRTWAWGVVVALLVIAILVGGAALLTWSAQARLAAEQAKTSELLTELASLSEVSSAIALQRDLESFREQAMASDLEWSPLLATLTGGLPAGVTLTGFDLAAGGNPQGEDPTQEIGITGTLTLVSATPIDLPPTVRTFRTFPGVIDADGREVTSEEAEAATDTVAARTYTYLIQVAFDQSVYTGAFAGEEEGE